MKVSEFEHHYIFEKLEQLKSRLNENEIKEKIEFDYLNFYLTSCDYIANKLKFTIQILTFEPDLATISQELTNALVQINNFLGNNNIGHLNNANSHINSAINKIKTLPTPQSKGDFDFSKVISIFETTLTEKLNFIEERNELINAKIQQIESELNKKDEKINSLNKLLEQKEKEIQSLNSTFQNEFNIIKSKANQEIEEDRKKFREEINSDRDNIESSTEEIIEKLASKLQEAKKLVNVIGNVGATGNFQSIANSHRRTANIFRIIAIIFMLGLSGILIYTIWDISINSIEWTKAVIRIIAAAALSYPATYAANESSKHRKQENYNRTIELELASINPFIEILDEKKKQEIKEKLVEKYFGNNNNNFNTKSSKEDADIEIPINGLERILKSVGNLIPNK